MVLSQLGYSNLNFYLLFFENSFPRNFQSGFSYFLLFDGPFWLFVCLSQLEGLEFFVCVFILIAINVNYLISMLTEQIYSAVYRIQPQLTDLRMFTKFNKFTKFIKFNHANTCRPNRHSIHPETSCRVNRIHKGIRF